ncbi:MAG TPA: Do family serine endopeptidase [Desulfobacterales bacterium]
MSETSSPVNAARTVVCLLLQVLLCFAGVATMPAAAVERESPVVKAVRSVSPAVVNISSEVSVRKRGVPFGLNPFFDQFFRDFFEPHWERRPERSTLGSGVIIDGRRGLIITNAHVVAKAGIIKVTLQDKREFEAEIVGADPDFDLAVLRIDARSDLPSVDMGSSNDLMIGETVIAIGNPFGFSHTVTTGVISALDRSIRTEDRIYHSFIQIDASINPGNSGGPLLNVNGELIGINTAIYAKAQGIGFAIPISKAQKIISDLIAHGEVIEAWIGLIVQNIDAALSRYLELPADAGVIVKEVAAGSPANAAGIREGDLLMALDARNIVSADDYQTAMREFRVGKILDLKLMRGSDSLTVSVKTEIFPDELAPQLGFRLLGIRVAELSEAARKFDTIEAGSGVVITDLRPGSHLAEIGAQPGDVIRRINEVAVRNTRDFHTAVFRYRHKNSVIVLLQRAGQGYYITVEM